MDTYRVELVNRGGIEIDVAPDVQILDAILRWRGDANEQSGLRLPVGCRYGACITCAAKLIAGEVDRSGERCLKPAQIATGYVLLCVAYARFSFRSRSVSFREEAPPTDCRFEVGTESQAAL
mgnify:FL=1